MLRPIPLINCLEELEWIRQHNPIKGDYKIAIIHIGMGYSIKIIRNMSCSPSRYETWFKCRGMIVCCNDSTPSVHFFKYDSEVVKYVNYMYNYARKHLW